MKRKLCFIMQDVFSLGGVQAVVSTITNYLVAHEACEITLIVPRERGSENPYDVSNQINIVPTCQIYRPAFLLKNARRVYFKFLKKRLPHNMGKVLMRLTKAIEYPEQYIKDLGAFLEKNRFEAVVGVGADFALQVALVKKYYSGKTVGWMHTTCDGYFYQNQSSAYGMYALACDVFLNLDRIFVLTKTDKDIFDARFGVNCTVLHNALPALPCKRSAQDTKCLIWVGRLREYSKGTDYLVEIFKRIHGINPEWKLLIVGDGVDGERLRCQLATAGLLNDVQMYGRVENDVLLQELYAKADISLNTSRIEGFGMAIAEAGACGVPTIAFANSGPMEIIEDGVNGIIIPPCNVDAFVEATVALMKDQTAREEMAEAILRRVKDFSIENIAKEFLVGVGD